MRVKKVTKRTVPGVLIVAVLGFGQWVEVFGGNAQDRVPARLAALYENSRLHYELHLRPCPAGNGPCQGHRHCGGNDRHDGLGIGSQR